MWQNSPLSNPDYRRLFAAQLVALVGTGFTTIALSLLAYDLAGGNAGVVLGIALSIKMVAYVVFAPIIGGLAHRLPRKKLLISLDIVRALVVLAMPFVREVWHIYFLIFVLNLFSAGFKPVFQAMIPDFLPDERAYTQALSLSRLAYDLENLLSPLLAGFALLFFTYTSLFLTNSVAFLISAVLIVLTLFPKAAPIERAGTIWHDISFGVRAYLKTPRLRSLLVLYMSVASASAMVIVNTVVYVRDVLGGTDSDTAMAFAAAGGGSMVAALSIPFLLDRMSDRPVMLGGAVLMAAGLLMAAGTPSLGGLLPLWFLVGFGWSLVQTPAGRVLNRSAAPADRSAYFSAQFALSHACWLIAYPIAGFLGAALGIGTTSLILGLVVLAFAALSGLLWPSQDELRLEHQHEALVHEHFHTHDEDDAHHQHGHRIQDQAKPHSHTHRHKPVRHSHVFHVDDHHPIWPSYKN